MPRYETFDVTYEHRTGCSQMLRTNSATITVYGASELKLKSEIEKQRPDHTDVTLLEIRGGLPD